MNPRAIIAGSFAVTLGFIAYQEIATCKEAPWPPRIIGAGIVFGMIDLLSLANDEVASVFAVGFTLAIVVATLTPAKEQTPDTKASRFRASCQHSCATAQPASYQSLDQPPSNTTLA